MFFVFFDIQIPFQKYALLCAKTSRADNSQINILENSAFIFGGGVCLNMLQPSPFVKIMIQGIYANPESKFILYAEDRMGSGRAGRV